ncbi:MAG: lipocalin [Desulfuromonas sp.]|nr:MAG: lipocalin [Desulfuromonas sp.]
MKALIMSLSLLLLAGCVAAPRGVSVVDDFDLDRYLGTWYEIACLDHRFERGLSKVSATYKKRDDGGIDVINRGFNQQNNAWKEAKGRAYPVGKLGQASLRVTFFWPFYAGYNVIELDHKDYQYAMVCGPRKSYLWILARQDHLDEAIVNRLVASAKELGFKTEELIYVEHGG